jgi:hypothetical protein
VESYNENSLDMVEEGKKFDGFSFENWTDVLIYRKLHLYYFSIFEMRIRKIIIIS